MKFSGKGRVEVTLGVSGPADDQRLCLAVRDTGMGIPPGKLNDIFEDFTQADGSVSWRYGGTGLGLAITRRLVHMHGGVINVQSRVNQGSVFQVELPLALPARGAGAVAGSAGGVAANTDTANAAAGAPAFPAAGTRVLVVEDNAVNQRVIASVLAKQGFEVELAANGREALSAMNRKAAHIVLMDVQMPDIDGITAARLIRENAAWRHVPIVALTAHAMQGDRERCLQAGMNDYLAKPSPPAAVIDCVRRHLQAAREAAAAEASAPSMVVPSRKILPRSSSRREESLETGMKRLFVRLAPERMEALKAAAERLDPRAIEEQVGRLASAAAGIEAHEAARCARELARDAALGDRAIISAALSRLQREMLRLDEELQALATPSQR